MQVNGVTSEQNIEIINGIPVDWDKFKSKASGWYLESSKKGYVNFCKLVKDNGHKLLSDYMDNKTKVLIDFNCGHEPHWISVGNYKSGHGCPKCAGKCPEQDKEDLIKLINENGHKLLSDYVNNSTKVLIDYNCGHEPNWITPNSYKKGQRCPKCAGQCPEQAKEELINLINKNGHKLLSEYINASTKVLIDFNCGHEPHWIKPNSYKNGVRCPYCKNKGEVALYDLLLDMGYEVDTQKSYSDLKDKRCLPYDFYLPKYNLLIELDGDHHRRAISYKTIDMTELERDMADIDAEIRFYDRKRKDKLKDEYAKVNNTPLLRIEYNSKIELDKWKKLISDKIEEIKNNKIA